MTMCDCNFDWDAYGEWLKTLTPQEARREWERLKPEIERSIAIRRRLLADDDGGMSRDGLTVHVRRPRRYQ